MLALGHGPLQFPPPLAAARERDPTMRERIVQAYEPKVYDGSGRYLVIGTGIASVNEWANALDAGAKVIALRRNPQPDEQDLNVPRCLFESQGVDAFQELSLDERIDFLGRTLRGTAPQPPELARARAARPRRRGASTSSWARSTLCAPARPACACTSRARTAPTPAGSTSPASSAARGS